MGVEGDAMDAISETLLHEIRARQQRAQVTRQRYLELQREAAAAEAADAEIDLAGTPVWRPEPGRGASQSA